MLWGNRMYKDNSDEKSLVDAKSFLFENYDMPSLIFPVTLWPGTSCAIAPLHSQLGWSS